jgi:hypothetical protein
MAGNGTSISFSADIRPLFRDSDVQMMKGYGGFDLSSYDDVKANADVILERLEDGSMPCDGGWTEDQVALFRDWKAGGSAA